MPPRLDHIPYPNLFVIIIQPPNIPRNYSKSVKEPTSKGKSIKKWAEMKSENSCIVWEKFLAPRGSVDY